MGKAGKYIGDDLDGLPLGLGQTNPKYFVRKHQKRFKISESKDACWAICFSLHLEITKILRNRSKVQICGADRKDSLRNELLYTHYYIVSIWWQRRPWGALCTCNVHWQPFMSCKIILYVRAGSIWAAEVFSAIHTDCNILSNAAYLVPGIMYHVSGIILTPMNSERQRHYVATSTFFSGLAVAAKISPGHPRAFRRSRILELVGTVRGSVY